MIKKFRIAKCQNQIWSIYSFWFCYIENNFTKSIDSNQFLKIFIIETSAIVLIQKFYFYEINVNDLNCLLIKIAISWLNIWNEIVWIQQKYYVSNWFLLLNSKLRWIFFHIINVIAINHAKLLLRQYLMLMLTKLVAKNSLLLLLIIKSLKFSICDMNLFENDRLIQLLNWFNCCFFHDQFL